MNKIIGGPDTCTICPLLMAVLCKSVSAVAHLLQHGANPNVRSTGRIYTSKRRRWYSSCNPLELALHLKERKIVQLLLVAGADTELVKMAISGNGRAIRLISGAGLVQLQTA